MMDGASWFVYNPRETEREKRVLGMCVCFLCEVSHDVGVGNSSLFALHWPDETQDGFSGLTEASRVGSRRVAVQVARIAKRSVRTRT